MTANINVSLNLITSVFILTALVTICLTYVFAMNSAGNEITSEHFYISSAWNHELSRITGNTGIPLVAFMIGTLVSAKYLQVRSVLPRRRGLLLVALFAGLIAAVFLIAACAVTTEKGGPIFHVILSGTSFAAAYISVVTFHIVESRPVVKSNLSSHRNQRLFRSAMAVTGIVSLVILIIFWNLKINVVGSVAELLMVFCILATAASFGIDLWDYKLQLTLTQDYSPALPDLVDM
jgi:Frag1/DRAM/Sfk1 family